MLMAEKQRIHWVDVARCFGIFAIYLGHYGAAAGNALPFVSTYHVPMFFFLSGCMETRSKDSGIKASIRKTIQGILIPWFLFCILTAVLYVLENNSAILDLWPLIWKIAKGTLRNTFYAPGLWFLTCMAVIKLLFALFKRRNKLVILLICIVCHVYAVYNVNLEEPEWLFNADIALYYMLYYGLGYVCFAHIDRALNPQKLGGKLLFLASMGLSGLYSAYLFFGRNLYGLLEGSAVAPVLTALTCIWFQFAAASVFRNVKIFREIGRNTLYLCGSEYLLKTLISCGLMTLGLGMSAENPLGACLWSAVTLWLANRYFVPAEKKMLNAIQRIPEYFRGKHIANVP